MLLGLSLFLSHDQHGAGCAAEPTLVVLTPPLITCLLLGYFCNVLVLCYHHKSLVLTGMSPEISDEPPETLRLWRHSVLLLPITLASETLFSWGVLVSNSIINQSRLFHSMSVCLCFCVAEGKRILPVVPRLSVGV